MQQIMSSDLKQAQQMAREDPRAKGREAEFLPMYLTHLISQDDRIPNDYCFLRFPAEEYQMSALAQAQQDLASMQTQQAR
jgi:hypothetical protein